MPFLCYNTFMAICKSSSKTTRTKIRISPKDADKILEQEFRDEKTGIDVKTIFRLSPEPYFLRIKLDGVQKKNDN